MWRLLLIFILTLSFQTLTKADDITDFEIEGISIGDSALDFFTKEEIKKNSKKYYKDKKFTPVEMNNFSFFKKYSGIDFDYKSNDPNYIIHAISGIISYKNKNIEKCYNQLDNIVNDIRISLPGFQEEEKVAETHSVDEESKITRVAFWGTSGVIIVNCYNYSVTLGWDDHLALTINTNKFNDFLITAYD
ncbi:hypothetical protein [Candidatus Pelagibacter sp. Uisw_127]|uniref:hypothetical protein n=1 Tax=Candidatus Pelagibacter sp. Uisw_127 TaxID=3230988 RepID=UPI0039EAD296